MTRFSCQPESLGSRQELQTRHSPRAPPHPAAGAQRKVLLRPDLVDPPTACPGRRDSASACRRKQAVQEHTSFSVSGWPSGLRRQTQGVYLPLGHSGLRMEAWVRIPLLTGAFFATFREHTQEHFPLVLVVLFSVSETAAIFRLHSCFGSPLCFLRFCSGRETGQVEEGGGLNTGGSSNRIQEPSLRHLFYSLSSLL